jgi:hypothetical protein
MFFHTICNRYFDLFVPALLTEAKLHGKTFDKFIQSFSADQFRKKLEELTAPYEINKDPTKKSTVVSLERSSKYPNFLNASGTSILVPEHSANNQKVNDFIQKVCNGGLTMYRGICVRHFSWDVLKKFGVLASEGSTDQPSATMGNTNRTRWLPFSEYLDVAELVAISNLTEHPGLYSIFGNPDALEVPVGAVINYNVTKDTPIAYLYDGEQVIRGPLNIEKVAVITSKRNKLNGITVSKLPDAPPENVDTNDFEKEFDGWSRGATVICGGIPKS